MDETLEGRVETLERAVTDGDHDLSTLAEAAEALDRLAATEDRLDELETQVEELDAATQALRGYVGNIRAVNSDVEQRADAALAKAEALEETVGDAESTATTSGTATGREDPPNGGDPAGATATDGHREGRSHRTSRHAVGGETPAGGETERRCEQGRETGGAPTGPAHDVETTGSKRQGTNDSSRTGSDHCHACGRPHGTDGTASPGSVEADGHASDNLVESGEKEPGTLERIREML